MARSQDAVAQARKALEHHAWAEAYEVLSTADRESAVGGEGLRLLGEASWWTGRPDEAVTAYERSHAAYLAEGDRGAAAMVAFDLAREYGARLAIPLATGWMAKAERLAAEDPSWPVHGYLAFIKAFFAFFADELDACLALYDQAIEVATRNDDRNLLAMSLHDKGQTLCMQGRVKEGMKLIDEAMVSTVTGELQPWAAGYVYCAMIALCSRLGDYRRAADWTDATTRWCERDGVPGFPGVCRIHRAELMRLRGAWPLAEEEARAAIEELPRFNFVHGLGPAHYEIGEVRLRMGDLAGAEEAFSLANQYGRNPQPGSALLRLAQGDVQAAAAGIAQAVEGAKGDRCARARLLAAQVEIAVAAGDPAGASRAADELEATVAPFEGPAMRALAAAGRGRERFANGAAAAAAEHLRDALTGWLEVDAPFEVAEVRTRLAEALHALGDRDGAVLELKTARTAFERLGARPGAEAAGALLGSLGGDAVARERVDRAFMFTDIVGSTDLIGAIGDAAWDGLLAWHDRTLRSLFAAGGGDVAHHTGDGFFVAFERPEDALRCAIAVQRALAEHRATHGFAPSVRIGIHAAEATRRGGDFSGGEVHKAARIAGLAGGGEILVSAETVGRGGIEAQVGPVREVHLKGISEPVGVAALDWVPR